MFLPFRSGISKKQEVVVFSSTAIALYGYDQGMMSLINTNYQYLSTMGIDKDSILVGVIVAVYYLGCAVGAVLASKWADHRGRKESIFVCLLTASLGNWLMFFSGLGYTRGALAVMLVGRVVMGLGVGGIDAVVPVYSSELASDESRGRALAQGFQMNIFGLNMAFAINLGFTIALGKLSEWAWRCPIVIMQVFPFLLFTIMHRLPETPRWFLFKDRPEDALSALEDILGPGSQADAETKLEELIEVQKDEAQTSISYADMLLPGGKQFHPTVITIMGQINQALTGYGAVSVYGPQIFELLGFNVRDSEYLSQGNYLFYLAFMTLAWLLIDRLGRRFLMVWGAVALALSFAVLTVCGGLATEAKHLGISILGSAVAGTVVLYEATVAFGVGWLATVWLVPTELYPSTARAQGAAISVVIWGLANFAITFLTPIMFNNLAYWLFLVFAGTNAFAGVWTWIFLPESGGRSFEQNQDFFEAARRDGTWRVHHVLNGEWLVMPKQKGVEDGDPEVEGEMFGETEPLLEASRSRKGVREVVDGSTSQ